MRPLRSLSFLGLAAVVSACATAPAPAPQTVPVVNAVMALPMAVERRYVSEFHRKMDESGLLAEIPATGRAILVNIPSFDLIAFEDRVPVLYSRVIVGSPRNQTPVMDTATSVIRFNPTWTPTPSMIATGKYRAGTRGPGPSNPLGAAAIRLAPGMLIYLHDTNKPALYEKEHRALSWGCVRTERWDEVAAWLMDSPLESIHARYGGRTHDVDASDVPVLIRYYTEFPDQTGQMRVHNDIYRRGSMVSAPSVRTTF